MTPEMFRKLAALGLSHEQMAGVLEIFEADAEGRKAKARDRVQRWREKKRDETKRNVTEHNETQHEGSRGGVARVEDNLQTKNQAGQEEGKKDARDARSVPSSFAYFWSLYPNKVGKRDAETAFIKALKRADLETILTGLRAYVAKTDDRPWCNPSTWLNQDRWEDAPATVVPSPRQTAPPRRERDITDVLGEIAAGTWTGPQERSNEPDFLTIDASYSRRN